MSASLDDIWDEPVEQLASAAHAPSGMNNADGPSPSKRQRTKLFLDSDSEHGSPSKPSQRPARAQTSKADVDALFDDLSDGEHGPIQDLGPSLDLNALRRQADARIAKSKASTSALIDLTAGDPTEDGDDNTGKGWSARGRKEKDGEKPRRKMAPRLDEARLLSSDGFPELVKQAKAFRPKGKGHEATDLKRLLNVYHLWSQKLHPKGQFRDNVERVEKLCHSRRMHVSLGVWRDEFKGLINGRKPENAIDLTSDAEEDHDSDEDVAPTTQKPEDIPNEADRNALVSSPSRPPSSASERTSMGPDGEDHDIEALIREDEERVAASLRGEVSDLGDDDTVYRSRVDPLTSVPNAITDEDEAMWDALTTFDDELSNQPPSISQANIPPQQASTSGGDDDEEMWDIVREMEEQEPAPHVEKAPGQETSASGASVATVAAPALQPTNDEGWDEMYL